MMMICLAFVGLEIKLYKMQCTMYMHQIDVLRMETRRTLVFMVEKMKVGRPNEENNTKEGGRE
jgi:hypothetical protein